MVTCAAGRHLDHVSLPARLAPLCAKGTDRGYGVVSGLRAPVRRCEPRHVDERQKKRLTDAELRALLDRLFPHGFAGPDVLDEIAPDGWERSPLLACFHPSIERVFEERLSMHRHLEKLRRMRRVRRGATSGILQPEPTLEDVQRVYEPGPVQRDEEVTELVGMCVWDIFSDNHEVITADGRLADLGSFRGSSAFLDEYLNPDGGWWREGDDMRFYMGTIFLRNRADLAPVYSIIFRRLHAVGADWIYHFPELYMVELPARNSNRKTSGRYSVAKGAAETLKSQRDRAALDRLREELAAIHAQAREEAMDRLPPATVRAYRAVYGRDPRGWPPT